jgi:hypothetical protein
VHDSVRPCGCLGWEAGVGGGRSIGVVKLVSVAGGGGGRWANDRYSKGGCWGGGGGGGGGIKVTPTEDANELTILLDNP